MKKFIIIFGIMLLKMNLFAQWQSASKKDVFKEPTGEYHALVVSEVIHNNQLIFTIITLFDYPEDSTQTQEPYTFFLARPKYQDYFMTSNNSYLTILDDKKTKHRINLKKGEKDDATAHVTIEDTDKFTRLLKINTRIKCMLVEDEKMQFMFTINCTGFTEAYNKTMTTSLNK